MNAKNRSMRRLFVLVAVIIAAVVLWRQARAVQPSPPHVIQIVEQSAYARLPDASLVELPAGTTFGAERLGYDVTARVTSITGSAEIFRDGFGAED